MNARSTIDLPHVRELLSKLKNVRPIGHDKWEACCPAHEDRSPSLSVKLATNESILINCHAGCTALDVVAAAGLELKDLFPPRDVFPSRRTPSARKPAMTPTTKTTKAHATLDHAIRAARWGLSQKRQLPESEIVTAGRWSYVDADGGEVMHVVRFNLPEGEKQFRPFHLDDGGYRVGDPPGPLPLYHLPTLDGADTVFVVEGEKCADAARSVGLTATTSAHGAKSPNKTDWTPLAGRDVAIIPDNDEPGQGYGRDVLAILVTLDPPARVKIIALPDIGEGEDVVEFVEHRRQSGVEADDDTFIGDEIRAIVSAAAPVTAPVDDDTTEGAPGEDDFILDPRNPLDTSRRFRRSQYSHHDAPTLHHAGDTFLNWNGRAYEELEANALRTSLYRFMEPAKKWVKRGEEMALDDFKPMRANIDTAIDALKAECYQKSQPPCWLSDDPQLPRPVEILPAKNGLVHLATDGTPTLFRAPTPLFFSTNALEYDYLPDAPEPVEWLKFLRGGWPNDPQSIELLQDWFGYSLTPDTSQQKILMVIGPPRSGKGTVARVLTALIGAGNVCGPTLAGLATNFGLWPLINKQLAIVSDARLSGRTDQAIVTERLLSISGEDSITIDMKNRQPVTAKLSTRFVVMSNELPRLTDSSGALANRFLILSLGQSHLGHEDTGLLDRLLPELPGILKWSIEGWRRLRSRGRFVQPATSAEAIQEMMDLSSPVGAFVREWCKVGPGLSIPCHDLYEAWVLWAKEQGTAKPTEKNVFARDLRAVYPAITTHQSREGDARYRNHKGIDLTLSGRATLDMARASKGGENHA